MLTQEAAGHVLASIVAVASLFLVIPAACSLAFLIILCQYLTPGGPSPSLALVGAPSSSGPSLALRPAPSQHTLPLRFSSSSSSSSFYSPRLLVAVHVRHCGCGAQVVTPLLVMYCLLALFTPLLVRIVHSTHNVIDAMNADPSGHQHAPPPPPGSAAFAEAGRRANKRPGKETHLAGLKPEQVA